MTAKAHARAETKPAKKKESSTPQPAKKRDAPAKPSQAPLARAPAPKPVVAPAKPSKAPLARAPAPKPVVAPTKKPVTPPSSGKKALKLVSTIKDMRKIVAEVRRAGRKVALVPTMGALHEGHLTLVRAASQKADFVVVSLFVNPTQFGPQDDFDRYPRDLAGDRKQLGEVGGDVLFAPETTEIYPEGFQTYVTVTDLTKDYCGAMRVGHFRGVATVVCKLLNVVQPDLALFGEKDYQQLSTIKQMVRDLNLDVEILGIPTVREEDGLAMSSRNAYLSPDQRQQAAAIHRALRKAKRLAVEEGERDAAELGMAVTELLREQQGMTIEYVVVCDASTLERLVEVVDDAVILVAVKLGDTRLIDNIRLDLRKKRD